MSSKSTCSDFREQIFCALFKAGSTGVAVFSCLHLRDFFPLRPRLRHLRPRLRFLFLRFCEIVFRSFKDWITRRSDRLLSCKLRLVVIHNITRWPWAFARKFITVFLTRWRQWVVMCSLTSRSFQLKKCKNKTFILISKNVFKLLEKTN